MLFTDNIAEFFAPMQLLLVMVIALIVFGPKKLPELGRQLGSALRELNKAKSEMMKSFSLDHEPDPEPYPTPYNYDYPSSQDADYSAYSSASYTPPPDYTDYTIVGQSVHEAPVAQSHEPDASDHPLPDGVVARGYVSQYELHNGAADAHTAHASDVISDSSTISPRDTVATREGSQISVEAATEGEHNA